MERLILLVTPLSYVIYVVAPVGLFSVEQRRGVMPFLLYFSLALLRNDKDLK